MSIVKLKNVRLSFPEFLEPSQFQGTGALAYSGSLLLEGKDEHQSTATLKKAIMAVAAAKWGAKAKAIVDNAYAKDGNCLHDGDLKDYDGYANAYYVSVRNSGQKGQRPVRPLFVAPDKSKIEIDDERIGLFYAGAYVNANIELWAQDNKFGKKVNANITGLQFVRDGDSFGGTTKVSSTDDFDDVSDLGEDDGHASGGSSLV